MKYSGLMDGRPTRSVVQAQDADQGTAAYQQMKIRLKERIELGERGWLEVIRTALD
jgi:hypothetical protein